jgi:hypothetical protein
VPACVCAAGNQCINIHNVIWRVCALPAIDAIGSRCQPSLRMASACSWQRCLGHILHADGGPGTPDRGGSAEPLAAHGNALQVELTTCRLGVGCDSCTMSSRSAADSGRAASATSGFIGSTVRAPSSEERISRAGPASGNRAQMLLQRSVAACVCWSALLRKLEVPWTTEKRAIRSIGFITTTGRNS